jgi:hypothetical protein
MNAQTIRYAIITVAAAVVITFAVALFVTLYSTNTTIISERSTVAELKDAGASKKSIVAAVEIEYTSTAFTSDEAVYHHNNTRTTFFTTTDTGVTATPVAVIVPHMLPGTSGQCSPATGVDADAYAPVCK